MVERYRRGGGKKLLGSHQKCWIWGRNAVLETLRAGRWPVLELAVCDQLDEATLHAVRELAGRLDTPLVVDDARALQQRCRSAEHQGFVARMTPFPYTDVAELSAKNLSAPLFVVCDRIQDPYNFGAIIRSCEVMGVAGVLIGQRNQVGVTSMAVRSSAGAVNHVPIARVAAPTEVVDEWRAGGIRLIGANEDSATDCRQCDFRMPTALAIGNEGAGLSTGILSRCDQTVRIPGCGQLASLNAAVAAGVLLYEARRQRKETA